MKPATATNHQPASSNFLSQQTNNSHQPQPAEQSEGDMLWVWGSEPDIAIPESSSSELGRGNQSI